MLRAAIVLSLVLSTGCLGSPEPPSCAELPPGSAGCGGADAATDRGPDVGPDAAAPDGASPDGAPPDAAPDATRPDATPDAADAEPAPDMAGCHPELCNGFDDDCDGRIDERIDGEACVSGVGICEAEGVLVCDGGALVCEAPNPPAVVEACNGLDDDCDGQIDERQRFTSDEVNDGEMLAVERPAIAGLDGFFVIARRVAHQGRGVELDPGEALVLSLYDRRGELLESVTAGEGARNITAYTTLTFTNGGDAGFLLLWSERVVDAAAETHRISALVGFPTADGFGDVDGPLVLRQTQGPVTALDGAAGPSGIGAAWIVGDSPRFGYLDFGDDPPALSALVLGGERLMQAQDIALTAAADVFVVAYTEGGVGARVRDLKLVTVDPQEDLGGAPVDAAAGDRISSPTLASDGEQVFLGWSEVVGGAEQIRAQVFDTRPRPRSEVIAVTADRTPAVSPRLAFGGDEVGLAWVRIDEVDGARSSVWFSHLEQRAGWGVAPAVRLSDGPARSGPVDLAAGGLFGAVWSDGRLRDPSAWARLGAFACTPDAVDQ